MNVNLVVCCTSKWAGSWAIGACLSLPSALEKHFIKQSKPFKCITMQPLTWPWLRIIVTKCQSWWITPSKQVSEVDFQIILKWSETSSCLGGRKTAFINLKTHVGTSQRSEVGRQGGLTSEIYGEMSLDFYSLCLNLREEVDQKVRPCYGRAVWEGCGFALLCKTVRDSWQVIYHDNLTKSKPNAKNDYNHCHVLSILALHKLYSKTAQGLRYHRCFTALFALLGRIYMSSFDAGGAYVGLWKGKIWDGNSWVEGSWGLGRQTFKRAYCCSLHSGFDCLRFDLVWGVHVVQCYPPIISAMSETRHGKEFLCLCSGSAKIFHPSQWAWITIYTVYE